MVLENLYEDVCDSRILWKKIVAPKIGKIDQKWVKNKVFWTYGKILSLIFTEFVL